MFDYIHIEDLLAMQTITIPKVLFSSQRFQELSPMAKVLYAMLYEVCNEDEEIRRNRFWFSNICMDLNSSTDEVLVWLKELESYDLVTMKDNTLCVHEIPYKEV